MIARTIRENKEDVLSESSQNLIGIGSLIEDDLLYGLQCKQTELELPCSSTIRNPDLKTGILFQDCMIDYTTCLESKCIKKLI